MFERFWLIKDNPTVNTDCFIVISHTVKKDRPTKMTASLIDYLAKQKVNAKVIMSTGDNQGLGISNAKIMADYSTRKGIDPKRIILEERSLDTYQNLLFSRKICDERKFKNPMIICYDLHAKRVIALTKKMGWGVGWVSQTSAADKAPDLRHIQTISRPTILLYEMLAYFYCFLKGQI